MEALEKQLLTALCIGLEHGAWIGRVYDQDFGSFVYPIGMRR